MTIQRLARELFESAARVQPDAVWATLINFLPVISSASQKTSMDLCSMLPQDLAQTLSPSSVSLSPSSSSSASSSKTSSFPQSDPSLVPITMRSYEDLWRQNLQMQLAITKSALSSATPSTSPSSPFEQNARWLLSRIDQTCERALPFVLQF
jgi:hypothetical protein